MRDIGRRKRSTTRGDPSSTDTKQWHLINDDKCCIQERFFNDTAVLFWRELTVECGDNSPLRVACLTNWNKTNIYLCCESPS